MSHFSTEELLEIIDRNAARSDEGGMMAALAEDVVTARREVVRVREEEKKRRFDAEFDACALARALWAYIFELDSDEDVASRAKQSLQRHSQPRAGFVNGGPCGLHDDQA